MRLDISMEELFPAPVEVVWHALTDAQMIGRWLMLKPKILILDEPTRGIDVGAKAEIHRLVCELAGQGVAVLMISSEMPEVLGMSDRVMVMHEGRMTGILDRADADQVRILQLASQ